jgi:hypothetical protein
MTSLIHRSFGLLVLVCLGFSHICYVLRHCRWFDGHWVGGDRGSAPCVACTDTKGPIHRQHVNSVAAPAAEMSRAPIDSDAFLPTSQSATPPAGHVLVNSSTARNSGTSFTTPSSAPLQFHDHTATAPSKPPPAFPIHGRVAWLACASIALLSARHLLVEQNLHYPLQLYFAQLAVSALVALRPCWTRQDVQEPFRERPEPRGSATRGMVLLVTSMCLMSVSTICALQAILHVQNLPTLIMMTVRLCVAPA